VRAPPKVCESVGVLARGCRVVTLEDVPARGCEVETLDVPT